MTEVALGGPIERRETKEDGDKAVITTPAVTIGSGTTDPGAPDPLAASSWNDPRPAGQPAKPPRVRWNHNVG